jgi:co-chaperonin GroES (HSP10)
MIICPFDRLVVKREEMETKSPGGIIIPDKVKSKHPPRRGMVEHAGDCCKYVKVGDTVIFDEHEALFDGIPDGEGGIVEMVFLKETDVLAIQRGE